MDANFLPLSLTAAVRASCALRGSLPSRDRRPNAGRAEWLADRQETPSRSRVSVSTANNALKLAKYRGLAKPRTDSLRPTSLRSRKPDSAKRTSKLAEPDRESEEGRRRASGLRSQARSRGSRQGAGAAVRASTRAKRPVSQAMSRSARRTASCNAVSRACSATRAARRPAAFQHHDPA